MGQALEYHAHICIECDLYVMSSSPNESQVEHMKTIGRTAYILTPDSMLYFDRSTVTEITITSENFGILKKILEITDRNVGNPPRTLSEEQLSTITSISSHTPDLDAYHDRGEHYRLIDKYPHIISFCQENKIEAIRSYYEPYPNDHKFRRKYFYVFPIPTAASAPDYEVYLEKFKKAISEQTDGLMRICQAFIERASAYFSPESISFLPPECSCLTEGVDIVVRFSSYKIAEWFKERAKEVVKLHKCVTSDSFYISDKSEDSSGSYMHLSGTLLAQPAFANSLLEELKLKSEEHCVSTPTSPR